MSIIDMSLTAIPLIAAIAAIRFFTIYKLPKKTFYVMWGIALYQLFIPYNLFARSDVSAHITVLSDKVKEIFIKTPEITDIVLTAENSISTADTSSIIIEDASYSMLYHIFDAVDQFGKNMVDRIEMINTTGTDIMTETSVNMTNPLNLFISLLPLIWLVGFLCFAAYFMVTHIKFRTIYAEALPIDSTFVRAWRVEYSDSMQRKVKIKQSDLITSPLTYGIFKPVILLPKTTDYKDESALRYILFHEYTHIWQFDTLSKLFLTAALCVHWFNPFVWLMYMLANHDIELSCDENVVRKTSINKSVNLKSDYALTLLALEEKKSLLALAVNFSRNIMKERIKSIMKIKKKSKLRIIAAVILTFMIISLFAVLQSCEDNTSSGIEVTNEQGEVIETQEIVVPPEPFEMQESTDKLLIYTFHMNTFTFTPAINIFKEKYPDVEVEVVNLGNDYETILATELAAGKGPDLVLAFDSAFPDIYKTMETGIFVDLNQFISRDSEFNLDDYVKPVLDGGVYQGKRYIMPVEYSVPILTTTQEILDAEGFTPADFNTFDGFIRTLEQYNEKYKDNPDKSALVDWKHNRRNLDYFLQNGGIDLIDYQTNKVGIDKENFKKIIDFIKPMYISEEARKDIDGSALVSQISSLMQRGGLRDEYWLFNNNFNTIGVLASVEHYWLVEDNRTPLMFTMPNTDDGLTAKIIQFAAIPKVSNNQINAYNLLKIILSEDIQAGSTDAGQYLRLGMPVLKSGVSLTIKNHVYFVDEKTTKEYTDMLINVDSAKMIPSAMYNFLLEEMTPYWEETKPFDDCYANLVNKLEIYISE